MSGRLERGDAIVSSLFSALSLYDDGDDGDDDEDDDVLHS